MPARSIEPAFFICVDSSTMVEETLDELSVGNLKLYQARSGYRYSLDPVLLAHFVNPGPEERILDLGTGSGILPLLLVSLYGPHQVLAIEIQADMAERARRNVVQNGRAGQIEVVHGDLRRIADYAPPASYHLVISNPPFRPRGGGRIAPDDERAMARHELAGDLNDFIAAACHSLDHGGRFAVIYLAERMAELLAKLSARGLEPKRLRMVHATSDSEARLVMVEARKGGRPGLQVEKPLIIYEGRSDSRNYTEEVLNMYRDC